jgi:hypothetical protein
MTDRDWYSSELTPNDVSWLLEDARRRAVLVHLYERRDSVSVESLAERIVGEWSEDESDEGGIRMQVVEDLMQVSLPELRELGLVRLSKHGDMTFVEPTRSLEGIAAELRPYCSEERHYTQ